MAQIPSNPLVGATPQPTFRGYPKSPAVQAQPSFGSYPKLPAVQAQPSYRRYPQTVPTAPNLVQRIRSAAGLRASALDLEYLNKPAWRRKLRLASFKGQPFYVDQQGRTSGRRTVVHQYPKRDLPYSEDMGREAIHYAMTGYLIMAPNYNKSDFYGGGGWLDGVRMPSNYDDARDNLETALLDGGPGRLVDPYSPRLMAGGYSAGGAAMQFMCEKYTITESRERGGYCVVEMSFVEYGSPGQMQSMINTAYTVATASNSATAAAASAGDNWQQQYQQDFEAFVQKYKDWITTFGGILGIPGGA